MTEPRYDWTIDEVLAVIERPFHDLLAAAHACHRERFDPHEIEGAKLLAILDPHPESVPINLLIQVPGTPLHGLPEFEPLELVRTIAAARIVMPESTLRLSAGRSSMSEETHALCLHAGASSIFSR